MFNSFTVDCSADLAYTQLDWNYTDGGGTGTLSYFQILRSTDNVTFTAIDNVSWVNGTNDYVYQDDDIGITCGTLIYYQVHPLNTSDAEYTAVSSTQSCTKDCTIQPSDPVTAPVTNCGSANVVSGITINWSAYPGNANDLPYVTTNVYRSTDATNFTLIATVATGVNQYTDTAVSAGTTYYYRVQHVFDIYSTSSSQSSNSIGCLLGDDCKDDGPIKSFDFSLSLDSNCNPTIPDLIALNGSYVIPTSHSCSDISSITQIRLKKYKCKETLSSVDWELLNAGSTYYDSTTRSFIFDNMDEGVWRFTLEVTYLDGSANTVVVTNTKCIYPACCHKCEVAKKAITKGGKLKDMFLLIDAIDYAIDCELCQTACELYNVLEKIIYNNECGC